MRFETFVGLRYLMAKRRNNVLSVITLISVGGVAVGVMALIVVLSVMGGFEGDLREKIIGAKAHIVVSGESGHLDGYKEIIARIDEVDGVVGAAAYVEGEVMVNSATNLQGVILRGVQAERIDSVSDLGEDMQEGGLEYLANPDELPSRRRRNFDENHGGMRLQSDDPDGKPTPKDMSKMQAAGARATMVFTGKDHGRFVRETLSGEANPPKVGEAVDDTESQEAGDEQALAEGEPAEELLDGQAEPLEPGSADEKVALGDDVRPATATLEPASTKRRVMKPVPGISTSTPAKRKVGGLILGKELQENLNVFLGHEVNVMSPMGDLGPAGSLPKSRPFKVVGVFYSGMYEYDTKFVYATLEDAQRFLNIGDRVTGIEVKIENLEQSDLLKADIEAVLADIDGVVVRDWRELNGNLFAALELEKIAMFVILTFVILVASFNIICLLIMIVIEKGREIAILKSMGANNVSVMRVFILQGGIIGVLGTLIGGAVGLGLCAVISTWGIQLPADVYYLSHVPVEVRPLEVATICGAAVMISLLATIPPSILAALLDPVAGLRYE